MGSLHVCLSLLCRLLHTPQLFFVGSLHLVHLICMCLLICLSLLRLRSLYTLTGYVRLSLA